MTAKRRSFRWTISSLSEKFNDQATYPAVDTVHIVCNVGVAGEMWGPIIVEANTVTVWDILIAIYEYFQTPVSWEELQTICEAEGRDFEDIVHTFLVRCERTPALTGYEVQQGLKRADCLGEAVHFWGMWITYKTDMTWQLNLGLVPDSL